MTGNSLLFSCLEPSKIGQVTFGDRAKGNVLGKGNINHLGAPTLSKSYQCKSTV